MKIGVLIILVSYTSVHEHIRYNRPPIQGRLFPSIVADTPKPHGLAFSGCLEQTILIGYGSKLNGFKRNIEKQS